MTDTPDPAALARAAELTGAPIRARQLSGGSHARTFLLHTGEEELILREFPPGDRAAADEERVLTALGGLGGLAPRLLAGGTGADGGSWVLISRLPGRADIHPADPEGWAGQLGRTLARLHAVRVDLPDTVFERRGPRERLSGPAAPLVEREWDSRIVTAPMVLTHGDYQSGNVIWTDGMLSGVVDWEGATMGPAGYDLGWCRLDLYLLHGEELAELCLVAYREAGGEVDDPLLWDLWTLARSHAGVHTWEQNYLDFGRADLTAAELRRRHDRWTADLVRRRSGGTRRCP